MIEILAGLIAALTLGSFYPTKVVKIDHPGTPGAKFSTVLDVCHRGTCLQLDDKTAACSTQNLGCWQAQPGQSIAPEGNE